MRRLAQVVGVALMVLSAGAALVFVVLAMRFDRLSSDVTSSGAGLPRDVRAALQPSPSTLDHAQVTLVRATGRLATGGALLMRTVPSRRTTAYLAIPPSATLAGVRVSSMDVPQLIEQLGRDARIPVGHVALIRLASLSRLVDAIGGIDVRNPSPFRAVVSPSTSWSFPRGTVHLDGRHTVAYLGQGQPHSIRRETAQEQVLRAIIGHAVDPSSISDLQGTAAAIAASAATDLTDADVLGMVWARLESRRLLQCTAAQGRALGASAGRPIVAAFMTPAATPPATMCGSKALSPAAFLPPKAAVAIVQRYGTWAFVLVAAAAALTMAGISVVLVRPRPAPAPRVLTAASPRVGRARLWHAAAAFARETASRAGNAWAAGRERRAELWAYVRHVPGASVAVASRSRMRVGRFFYWHPDAIWAIVSVTLSIGLAVVIASA
jgi:hypothetical protein